MNRNGPEAKKRPSVFTYPLASGFDLIAVAGGRGTKNRNNLSVTGQKAAGINLSDTQRAHNVSNYSKTDVSFVMQQWLSSRSFGRVCLLVVRIHA